MKTWAYKNPLGSSITIMLLYLFVARTMILANSFNIMNNGVALMIVFLFVFLWMMIREILQNAKKEVSKTKKQVIWGLFSLVVISVILYSNILGIF